MFKTLKPALLFLLAVLIADFLFRKGFIMILIPVGLPPGVSALILYALFTFFAWLATKFFTKSEGQRPADLGISFSEANRSQFIYGFLAGIILWGLVVLSQAYFAGFNWIWREDVSVSSVLYGLLFIFIADWGTELFDRGYGLSKLQSGLGSIWAIGILAGFVGLRSISFNADWELLLYGMLIPILHALFFSFIYFKTKRLGASLGLHTGANFVSISIFDLRDSHPNQAIASGLFQADTSLDQLSMHALQLPWVAMAMMVVLATWFWWKGSAKT